MENLNPVQPPVPENPPAEIPPPAAVIVTQGERTEREIVLERELQEERLARKKAETDAGYAQDEARRLKDIQKPPGKTKSPNWTLLHEAED